MCRYNMVTLFEIARDNPAKLVKSYKAFYYILLPDANEI